MKLLQRIENETVEQLQKELKSVKKQLNFYETEIQVIEQFSYLLDNCWRYDPDPFCLHNIPVETRLLEIEEYLLKIN